jgi:hypothetical protein
MRKFALILLAAALPLSAQQAQQTPQVKYPRPSPKSTLTQSIGNTDVTINYSRPGVKGRPVWGALVPYDQVWRTGANEATTIAFSDDVTINGQKLAKGTYSLHSVPSKSGDWEVIFNSVADQWGSYSYDKAKDVVRVKVKAEKAPFTEWMTFEVPEVTTDTGRVVLRWESVAVPFTVNTDTTSKTLASAREAIGGAAESDWQTPYRAASFAFDAGVTGSDATTWNERSLKVQENASNLWLKARMQAKAGDKAAARATAQKAIDKATPQQAGLVTEIKKYQEMWK